MATLRLADNKYGGALDTYHMTFLFLIYLILPDAVTPILLTRRFEGK